MKRFVHILTLLLILLQPVISTAQDEEEIAYQDSLYNAYINSTDEHQALLIADEIARTHYNVDTVKSFARRLVIFSRDLNKPEYEALGHSYLAWAGLVSSDYADAAKNVFRTISIADSIGDQNGVAHGYALLGDSYMLSNDVNSASLYYQKAIDIYTAIDDKHRLSETLTQMAQIASNNLLYETAEDCINKANDINIQINNKHGLGLGYANLGNLYLTKYLNTRFTQHDPRLLNKAHETFNKALALTDDSDHAYRTISANLAKSLYYEANITTDRSRKALLIDSCKHLIGLSDNISLSHGYPINHLNHIRINILRGNFTQAQAIVDSIHAVYGDSITQNDDDEYDFFIICGELCEAQNKYKEALKFYNTYFELNRNIRQGDFAANVAREMAKGEFEHAMNAREVQYLAETQIRNAALIFVCIVLFLAVIFTFIIIRDIKKINTTNHQLDIRNNELEIQKDEILKQNITISSANKQITDSINYASLILKAALPSEAQINSIFGPHLLIYRPHSIISGDFFWAVQHGPLKMIAVADSTGHGVPGALLSMLGISTLNEISTHVNPDNISAGAMLDEMKHIVKESLHQHSEFDSNNDGMDVALAIIDSRNLTMHFAGAFRPAFIIRDNQLIQIKPDRMPVGNHYKEASNFTDIVFQLLDGDSIYLFSDGMTDQFGYDENHNIRKFTARRFRDLLISIAHLPFNVQKMNIDNTFARWRHPSNDLNDTTNTHFYEQTDDALLIGLKIQS